MREGNRRLFNNYQMPKTPRVRVVPLTFLIVVQFLDHMMTPLKVRQLDGFLSNCTRELVVDVANIPSELLHLECYGWEASLTDVEKSGNFSKTSYSNRWTFEISIRQRDHGKVIISTFKNRRDSLRNEIRSSEGRLIQVPFFVRKRCAWAIGTICPKIPLSGLRSVLHQSTHLRITKQLFNCL